MQPGSTEPSTCPADAADSAVEFLGRGHHDDVAGRGSHDTGQHAGTDARPDGPDMGVDRPDSHGNTRRQPQPRGPFAAQPAGISFGGMRFGRHAFGEAPQPGPQSVEERRRGPAAPRRMPQALVSGGTTAPENLFGTGIARQQRAHPIAVFDPGIGRFRHRRVGFQNMQHFRPDPLRRIDAARIARVIRIGTPGRSIDLRGFTDGRMVFPQHEHRVRLLRKARRQSQRRPRRIGQDWGGTGRIERQGTDFAGTVRRNCGDGPADRSFERFGVIQRMLAVTLTPGVAVESLFPARVRADRRSRLAAVRAVHDQSAAGVRPVIYSDNIFSHDTRSSLHTKIL